MCLGTLCSWNIFPPAKALKKYTLKKKKKMKMSIPTVVILVISVSLLGFTSWRYTSTSSKYKDILSSQASLQKRCEDNNGIPMSLEGNELQTSNKMIQFMLKNEELAHKVVVRSSTGGGYVHLPTLNDDKELETTAYVCPMKKDGTFHLVM